MEALKILGIAPCSHMETIMPDPLAVYEWGRIGNTDDDNERRERIRRFVERKQGIF